MKFKVHITSLLLLCGTFSVQAKDIVLFNGKNPVSYTVNSNPSPVVNIALNMFSSDMQAVTGKKAKSKSDSPLAIYQLDALTDKEFKEVSRIDFPLNKIIVSKDAFWMGVKNDKLYIIGNNGRGTAYGILELSKISGVSPWIWWGDVHPEKKSQLIINDKYQTLQVPSVEYRGIFINDEDWSTRTWAHKTLDRKQEQGTIGPNTYRKIFELLLRLKANTIWPAMHPGTKPFFQVKGNQEVADSCDIYIGTSHCEPLLRNNVGEWNVKNMGAFNYLTNQKKIEDYWTYRIKETAGMDVIYTLGMRGIHDGSMEGVKTLDEKTKWLQKVINDQRKLLHKNLKTDIKKIPQIFVPYKEVLDIYNNGLKVPDDVTLMWCDDNYGYLTHLSNPSEAKRSGGSGVYYHLSYWGRPHDYLWLTTTQPGLIYEEMHKAYTNNNKRIWIANVHDPKVAAYDLSLFLDMAWNINITKTNSLQQHMQNWLCQQFGTHTGKLLLPVMKEFYHLTAIRKPEFMGWTQTELDKKKYNRGLSPIQDTEFNAGEFGNEIERYKAAYQAIKEKVEEIEKTIRPTLSDAYFAAIKYPIFMAADMAIKQLEAQEARHIARPGLFFNDKEAMTAAANSMTAHQEIIAMTKYYNEQLAGGKWNGIMSMSPRDLPVFKEPALPGILTDEQIKKYADKEIDAEPLENHMSRVIARNAVHYTAASKDVYTTEMLGHSMNSLNLPKGSVVKYNFLCEKTDSAIIRIATIPTHAVNQNDIRFSVTIDGNNEQIFTLKEPFRSEQWKQNVLRGQAVKSFQLLLEKGTHTLEIKALDEGIILDQWMIDYNLNRKFYMFPIEPAI
ncbi:glycosyl hydrolase 115 family protein [Segatella bryantii]|uniref:glycosyl hydrolase 115 family protein n=1 Tax=Segatella bryantii TaxID=77095 RepID=UPI001EDB47B8|nr:glycosyl hydrolase 115 family protein [Segatella bryantii]UKK75933.1 glycosyl hydrolase 115 family protein [Segatella bryantii]